MNNPAPLSEAVLPAMEGKSPAQAVLLANYRTPAVLRPLWSILLLSWLVRLSALINLIAALLPIKPNAVSWLMPWAPFEISDELRIRMLMTSVLLFILASGLERGKRMAWILTIGALVITPLLHFGRATIWPQMLINLGLIVFLLLHHRYFVVRSDPKSVRSALLICSVLALALLIFGTQRLYDLRFETWGPDSWLGCLQAACELIFAHQAYTQGPQTLQAFHFFSFLRVSSTWIALLGLYLTMRPVLERRRILDEYREKVQDLIDQYGHDPFDSYAVLHDKSYFFTADDQVVVPYVLSGNFAVVLANPIGHPLMRPMAIVDFALFCRQQDWEPVFYSVTSDMAHVYAQAGFSLFKIGEGVHLKTREFQLKGGDFQNLRTICNKARKLGIQFRWYNADQGIDETLEHQLAAISQRWLEAKKAREMSFDMGAFSVEDIRRNGAAVAVDAKGNALAFATWRSFARGKGRALDLMRTLPYARNVMDFVLVESIAYFRNHGVEEISLGLAPLANTQGDSDRLLTEEKMVQFLFENLDHIYGYRSLFEFKRKYRPQWRGHYVAYRRGVHLPLVGLALVRVHAPEGIWKFLIN
jgi:lysylphosphatidylglycerol synthetase-like protein (DUF2156 family)